MRIDGSYDMCHCHGLTGIAGYVVVRIRAVPGPASAAEARDDLAVLEGAGQYPQARGRAASLQAGHAGPSVQFGVDVVYDDGCRMPW